MPTNRRRHIRRSHPILEARLGSEVYRTIDWSFGGLAVGGLAECLDQRSDGAEITGYFGVSGEDIAFKFSAVVSRIDAERDVVGLDFTTLWPESAEILEELFRRPPSLRRPPPQPVRPKRYLLKALNVTAWNLADRQLDPSSRQ